MSEELDDIAQRYYDEPPTDEWIEDRVCRWIMPQIIKWCGGRVLEMGYGAGRSSQMLIDAGIRLDIVEGSQRLADRARADLHSQRGDWDIFCAPFEVFHSVEVYDTVLCCFVLEHVEDPVGLLERVCGWIRPGGRLICTVPNADSLHRRVGALMTGQPAATLSERDVLVGHRRVYTIEALEADVARAFDVSPWDVARFGWFTKPVPNALMVDWPPEMIDALCEIGWHARVYDCANIGVEAYKPSS